MEYKETVVCCLCGKKIRIEDSNSALPIYTGRCCDECFINIVATERMKNYE